MVQGYEEPGILGYAFTVFGDQFARFGVLAVNANSIGSQRNSSSTVLLDTIIHEIGHVLGIGTLWESDAPGQMRLTNSTDCSYIGKNANRVYQELSGCPADTTLPVEVFEFSDGSFFCGAHLQEQCFGNEVMSPHSDSVSSEPISNVTVALLEDLGYTVDYDQADSGYTKDDMNASCVCNGDDGSSPASNNTRMLVEEGEDEPSISNHTLSDEGHATIVKYAENELQKMKEVAMSYMISSDDYDSSVLIGISGMTVMYIEDGAVHSVYVPSKN